MSASKEKSLQIWEMPKSWIEEDKPSDDYDRDEEVKFKPTVKKVEKPIEEVKQLDSDEEDEKLPQPIDNKLAFKNMSDGFDPLGVGRIKRAEPRDDDYLAGWHK